MDDDDEDFETLFFTECQELLADLQEHLGALADGMGDAETVNAAFRSVHSVKGGAAAFGFNDLISFAHVFETVMDKIRSDQLELNHDIIQVLRRSGDVMEVLIENARDKTEPPKDAMTRVLAELEDLAGAAPTLANDAAKAAGDAPQEPESADASGDDEAVDDNLDDEEFPQTRELAFSVAPGEAFFRSGHDPLRMIRSARSFGLANVSVTGNVPNLADFEAANCPLKWVLSFDTEKTREELEDFFSIYSLTADIEFIPGDEGASDEENAPAPAAVAEVKAAAPLAKAEPVTNVAIAAPALEPDEADNKKLNAVKPGAAAKSLRVELPRIDRLVNLVGEMLITQAGLAQRLVEADSDDNMELGHSVDAMSRQLRELQESVMAIRAQPIKSVFSRMPRIVRDLADKLNKDVRLELSGENTEVDTTVIEELAEPLTHMLRNSMDHGLEDAASRIAAGKPKTGVIRLSAEHRGERVTIVIEDDGRGVNRERVMEKALEKGLVAPDDVMTPDEIDMLIFHPGFSTATEVSAVSGRGVGMDIVKKKIQSLGGRCTLKSVPGQGAKFTITLPLTLAVMDGMIITVAGQHFILPLSSVIEALRVDTCTLRLLPDGSRLLERRGDYLKLISLRSVLQMPAHEAKGDMAIIVDTETNGLVALIVDDLIGQRQVVLKSLEANFKRVEGISGATILGDGKVALILDVPALMNMGGNDAQTKELIH